MNNDSERGVKHLSCELSTHFDKNILLLFDKVTSPDNILPEGMKISSSFDKEKWTLKISGSFSVGRLKNTIDEIMQHLILISQCSNLEKK